MFYGDLCTHGRLNWSEVKDEIPFRYVQGKIRTQMIVICGPTRYQLDQGDAHGIWSDVVMEKCVVTNKQTDSIVKEQIKGMKTRQKMFGSIIGTVIRDLGKIKSEQIRKNSPPPPKQKQARHIVNIVLISVATRYLYDKVYLS